MLSEFPIIANDATADKSEAIEIIATANIEAAPDASGTPKFTTVAYTGGILKTNKYPKGIIVDLQGLQPSERILANLKHDQERLVGHVTNTANDGKKLTLDGLLSYPGEPRNEVIEADKNGFPWNTSIEALPYAGSVEHIAAGKIVTVNGQTFAGPVDVARKSILAGVGFVPRGADQKSTVTIAASAANIRKENEPMNFEQWIMAMQLDLATLTDAQKAALKKDYDSKAAQPEPIKAASFDAEEISEIYAEHSSNLEVVFANREEGVPAPKFAEIKAAGLKTSREIKKKAVSEKWAGPKLEVELIKAASAIELKLIEAERPTGPAIHSSRKDMSGDVIEAALCQSLNIPDYEKGFSDKILQTSHSQFRGRMGLQQAIIIAAAQNGMPLAPGDRISDGNLREVLRFAFPVHASAFTAFSLSGILSNVANKELLAGYMTQDQTWREISDIKTANNFQAMTSYRMIDGMEYEALSPTGHMAHGKIGEESYTRQIDTFAKMFALTRKQIINDDLGAFDDIRTRLGRGALLKFLKVFWTEFLADASTFWTAAKTNYITGATTNLGTDGVGLGLGATAYRERKSPAVNSDETTRFMLGGEATKLLVPSALTINAEILYKNTNLASVKASDANIHAGKYRPITVTQLGDSSYSGYSTTAWYLFGNEMNPMVVSFLNGNQTPTVESADADFDQLGIQFRGYHDFGCNKSEYMAGIKSKGAA